MIELKNPRPIWPHFPQIIVESEVFHRLAPSDLGGTIKGPLARDYKLINL